MKGSDIPVISVIMQLLGYQILRHTMNSNKGVKYPCDQCDYASTRLSDLKTHKESKNKRISYPWDQCEYAASRLLDLSAH